MPQLNLDFSLISPCLEQYFNFSIIAVQHAIYLLAY